jgi:DNA primase
VKRLTKNEIDERKEQLKIEHSATEILGRYGIETKRGRCKSICHDGDNFTAKVSDDFYYCFKCDKSMDIFDITMHFNNCDFWTAFELLGGTEKPSFRTMVKANLARKEREQRIVRMGEKKARIRQINTLITAYRNIIEEENRMSDLYAYCYNKMQYQIYLLECHAEKR